MKNEKRKEKVLRLKNRLTVAVGIREHGAQRDDV